MFESRFALLAHEVHARKFITKMIGHHLNASPQNCCLRKIIWYCYCDNLIMAVTPRTFPRIFFPSLMNKFQIPLIFTLFSSNWSLTFTNRNVNNEERIAANSLQILFPKKPNSIWNINRFQINDKINYNWWVCNGNVEPM